MPGKPLPPAVRSIISLRSIALALFWGTLVAFIGALLWYAARQDIVKDPNYYLVNLTVLVLAFLATAWVRTVRAWVRTERDLEQYRASPPRVPEIKARARHGLTTAVKEAEYSLCAVSSKPLALWQSPTFTYYLMVQGAKTVVRLCTDKCASAKSRQKLTIGNGDPASFLDEEKAVLTGLAQRSVPGDFFSLRFLVYPRAAYKEHEDLFTMLIQAHNYFRVHCVPLVWEDLDHWLDTHGTPDQARHIKDFAAITHCEPDYPCPDFLMVNLGAEAPRPGGSEDKRAVWWFQQTRDRTDLVQRTASNSPADWESAGVVIQLLAGATGAARWVDDPTKTADVMRTQAVAEATRP